MKQLKESSVRFGFTPPLKFKSTLTPGEDWKSYAVTFTTPFVPPMPGIPKGVPLQISVVATPTNNQVAPVVVIKNVTSTGFTLWARNVMYKEGSSQFAWLAVLGMQEGSPSPINVRLGILQTKVLASPQSGVYWPGIWYSTALPPGGAQPPAVLLTAHNISGPSLGDKNSVWNNPAAVVSSYPMNGGVGTPPSLLTPEAGFAAVAINVDTDGRCGYYYAAFVDVLRTAAVTRDTSDASELWLDHGSDKGAEDSFEYVGSPFTPPNRQMKPGGVPGDWVYLDVYFDRPFLTPPIVLATARDTDPITRQVRNPIIPIAQNVTTHGFTMAMRNTDSVDATAEFYWVAIGCKEGCA